MSRYDILLPQTPTPADSHGYGTVASVSPLTVLLDGDSTPVYCTSVASVGAGDRVLVLTKRLQRIVLGRVGGTYDSGWNSITPAAGITASTLRWRRIGATIYVDGTGITRSGGWPAGSSVLVGTLPAGVRPSSDTPIAVYAGASLMCVITTAGGIVLISPTATSPAVTIGGSYPSD